MILPTMKHAQPTEVWRTTWDYLVVTASNEAQADSYRLQIRLRQELGLLTDVAHALVVPDPGGKRVGSGGSTLYCLTEVLNHRLASSPPAGTAGSLRKPAARTTADLLDVLQDLRILILHAGGDSRRLPAYAVCGKLFIPMPGEGDSCLPPTLFDRQISNYLSLPAMPERAGQVVIASGDVMLHFDPKEVRFAASGITGLGCLASPEQAAGHGVFCCDETQRVRRFLQKRSPAEQAAEGAIDAYGNAVLDVGVTNLDARSAMMLLEVFGVRLSAQGLASLAAEADAAIGEWGMDFYREICCALGSDNTQRHYLDAVRRAGSQWDAQRLERIYGGLHALNFQAGILARCGFLHFGTSEQIIRSGYALLQHDQGRVAHSAALDVTNDVAEAGQMVGPDSWVEGCRLHSRLTLGGENVVVGLDIDEPLSLPAGACLDVVPADARVKGAGWVIRCYGVRDDFKTSFANGATFCGMPVQEWIAAVGAGPEDLWDTDTPAGARTCWNARLFPREADPDSYRRWLWMFAPTGASQEEKSRWRLSERCSLAQVAALASPEAFLARRLDVRAAQLRGSLRRIFRRDSGFAAADLALVLAKTGAPADWVACLLGEAQWNHDGAARLRRGLDSLTYSRILHTLSSALSTWAAGREDRTVRELLPELDRLTTPGQREWLKSIDAQVQPTTCVRAWSKRLATLAFRGLEDTILAQPEDPPPPPVQVLRSDEIVWGRAAVRLDSAGGWSDTPPYALEHGGRVVNTAVDLNGQPPIQVYGRVIERPVIRITSIDLGVTLEIADLATLMDYRTPDSEFALAKAALAISGFSPTAAAWPKDISLEEMLRMFHGGIELTTLAAIPKGSGLGTSSMMGAVIVAVIQRIMGRTLGGRELFHTVLRLEQALTTGGGWQDQIGGVVGGTKIISTRPGLIPDPTIHYLPTDVIDPKINGGCTLLYYTGITRLAKDILEQVVGRYLHRDRRTGNTLRRIHELPTGMADAISRKDLAEFGRLTDTAWRLNQELDPNSTNAEVESVMARIRPFVHGAKLVGAGGGGFMYMVCRSSEQAQRLRAELESGPPNPRARFFDFSIDAEGLVVTVC